MAGEFPDIRAVILTGAGRGFCSGADVGDMAQGLSQAGGNQPRQEGTNEVRLSPIVTLAPHLRQIPQPIIAAVNGVAAGAGLSITLACDIRIASEAARFSCIFVKRSLVPDTGASYTLPTLVGPGIAAEMALTGKVYDAPWALQVGLVNRVISADQLMEEARALGEEIAGNPPLAVRASKQILYAGRDLNDVLPMETAASAPMSDSEDRREAVLSFVENRQPVYKGR